MRLFGTDGVRGIPGKDLTNELAFQLGRSAAYELKDDKKNTIVIGRDTRLSGDILEKAIVKGICFAGVNAIGVEVIPTPAISFLTRKLNCCGGVVISASHNPSEYNGIKFFDKDGVKLNDGLEKRIEDNLEREESDKKGNFRIEKLANEKYEQHLHEVINVKLEGINVALDCANGSTYITAPEMYKRLGASVIDFACEPDGNNINESCGSTKPELLEDNVIKSNADIGFAYDGDGDRVIAVDEKGEHVDGDFIMAICAIDMKERGLLKNNMVVTTVMTNLGFHQAMEKHNIKVLQTPVGDKYVLDKMREVGASLGGEQSGHIIFLEYGPTGDGILTSIELVDIIKRKNKPLSLLKKSMKRLPQILINVVVEDKAKLKDSKIVWQEVKTVEEELKDRGRILVRPSGTESLVRVMIESDDKDHANETAKRVADVIKKELN